MARVGIIGGGAFGTAMACVVRRSGHDVVLWAREPEVAASQHFSAALALLHKSALNNAADLLDLHAESQQKVE